MRIILFLVVVAGVIAFLMHQFPSALQSDEQKSNLIYSTVLLVAIGAGLISRRDIPWKHHAKYALAWLAILIVIMIGYSFRGDIMNSRFMAELIPSKARMNEAGELVLYASDDGHFYLDALVNHERMRFLIDTGASSISLSQTDAIRAGIDVENLTYNIPYSTANGTSFNASANIEILEVSGMQFKNLPVSISQGGLDISLLGMNFLREFKSYSVEGDVLTLVP